MLSKNHLGLSLMGTVVGVFGGSNAAVYTLDTEAVLIAVDEAGLVDRANEKNYDQYRKAFQESIEINSIRTFLTTYEGKYDPDNLIATAKERLAEREAAKTSRDYRVQFELATSSSLLQAFIRRYDGKDPDNLVPVARERLKAAQASEEEQRRSREAEQKAQAVRIETWRNRLKAGDDTFCGPVIENRGGMVKVYHPIKNIGNEQWMKREAVLPPGEPCHAFDGIQEAARERAAEQVSLSQGKCESPSREDLARAARQISFLAENSCERNFGHYEPLGPLNGTCINVNGRQVIPFEAYQDRSPVCSTCRPRR